MPENKYVRLASVHDAAALVRLNREFNGVEMSMAEVEQSLMQANELVAVAILNEELVGFACAQSFSSFCYHELQGEITEMYVEEGARRRGLASQILVFLEKELTGRGVTTIKIVTGSSNQTAIQTYEKSAFIQKDRVILEKKAALHKLE
ncbi:GNAT family N-acetyltransferase [Paenibacillus caui]|uniref:GNAT family N-acetyltransferase n=1 Tax=Paenibacillus caui TaxID=2873927 RepID=UPI001CA8969F|nr:GNAT family N-acetyltransferase [Paenibacillus caui]